MVVILLKTLFMVARVVTSMKTIFNLSIIMVTDVKISFIRMYLVKSTCMTVGAGVLTKPVVLWTELMLPDFMTMMSGTGMFYSPILMANLLLMFSYLFMGRWLHCPLSI